MNWRHIKLIYFREMRDQLRDRRTLFTITILPLLLYPLLGMLMMQVAQFRREHAVNVRIVGNGNWPSNVPLLADVDIPEQRRFVDDPPHAEHLRLLDIELDTQSESLPTHEEQVAAARAAVDSGQVDAVLLVDPRFAAMLSSRSEKAQSADQAAVDLLKKADETNKQDTAAPKADVAGADKTLAAKADQADAHSAGVEGLTIVANMARDRGQLAVRRLQAKLNAWQQRWVALQLRQAGVNPVIVEPIPIAQSDTSESSVRRAMIWSKILPFIMLVWALTGAFYPAIDLCAGEKERGTLETLLSSPARRREIVWGKLLTVATFSMMSALLNLGSMQATAGFVLKQLTAQGNPQVAESLGQLPIHAFGWLVLLLIPMSAFFSALALAVAALARSTKEGQYYLMPLLLFTLPLVTLPMVPSLELNLGTSLVPVSGAIFVVRAFIEGRILEGLMYLPFVTLVTSVCCLLSIRWAVKQFESESVMFTGIERWSFQSWIKQVWRDRGVVASPVEAALCAAIILVATFFSQFVTSPKELTWGFFVERAVTSQIGIILTPSLLMAVMLTRSLRQALRLHAVPIRQLAAAILLGVALHPSYTLLGQAISSTFTIGPETLQLLNGVTALINAQPLWGILLVLAIIPAVCEELTFRGFIFAGLLRNKGAMRAILFSSIVFGLAHSFLQQSIAAGIMGLLLGIIAWRTGSVLCTMLIHVINNSMSLGLSWAAAHQSPSTDSIELPTSLQFIVQFDQEGWHYQPTWYALSIVLTLLMLVVLWRRSPATEQLAQAEAL